MLDVGWVTEGPTMSRIESPASRQLSSEVALPMACTTMVIGAGDWIRAFDGEGNALALLVQSKNEELARFAKLAWRRAVLNDELLDLRPHNVSFDTLNMSG